MSSFKNALEDVVIKEAHKQLKLLGATIGNSVRLADVVAHTLNRLPPLYATSSRGWSIQRRRLLKELRSQIVTTVSTAITTLSMGDRRRNAPLPEIELNSKARALISLRRVLGQPNLRWCNVPEAIAKTLGKQQTDRHSAIDTQQQLGDRLSDQTQNSGDVTIWRSPEDTDIQADADPKAGLNPEQHDQIEQFKAYWQRTRNSQQHDLDKAKAASAKEQRSQLKVAKNANGQDLSVAEIEAQQLEIYTLSARLEFSNVLEKLVLLVAGHLTRDLEPQVRSQINLNEVAAYALNRLPPMYAASDREYRYQRQRAQSDIAAQITAVVKQGIELVLANPSTNVQPLPFEKFNQEYDLALPQIKQLLKCRNITLSNVAAIAADIIKFKHQNIAEPESHSQGKLTSQSMQIKRVKQTAAPKLPAQPRIVGGYYQPTATMYS